MSEDRLYAVRLLWVRDPDLFAQYQEIEVVVTWFTSSDARRAFETDPEFEEAAEIRDKAAKLVTLTGRSVFGD